MRVYRASSLGYSLEALVAPHLGYEGIAPPEFLQAAYDEGNRIEPLTIAKLREWRWIIKDRQEEVNAVGDHQIEVELEVIPGTAKVVGHLDGILREGHWADYILRNCVLEIKSMAAKAWESFDKHGWDAPGLVQKYKWQASAYMLATGKPLVMIAWNKATEDIAFALATEPFYTISDIAAKIADAEAHIAAGTIPEGCKDFPCPYFHLHAPSDNPVEAADEELDHLMEKWLSLDNHVKAYKKEQDALREDILAITGTDGLANVRGRNGVTVTTTWQEAKEYMTKRKEGWTTRISAPRRKNGD